MCLFYRTIGHTLHQKREYLAWKTILTLLSGWVGSRLLGSAEVVADGLDSEGVAVALTLVHVGLREVTEAGVLLARDHSITVGYVGVGTGSSGHLLEMILSHELDGMTSSVVHLPGVSK